MPRVLNYDHEFEERGEFAPPKHSKSYKPGSQKNSRGREALPHSAKIGDAIVVRGGVILGEAFQSHSFRPAYIYGIYRKDERIVAVDIFYSTTNLSRVYPHDLIISSPKALGDTRCSRLQTNKLCMLLNSRPYIVDHKANGAAKIPKESWPDIIARRANALMFNPENKYNNAASANFLDDPEIEREGFNFDMQGADPACAPELPGAPFIKKCCDILTPEQINIVIPNNNRTCYAEA